MRGWRLGRRRVGEVGDGGGDEGGYLGDCFDGVRSCC